jgi:radical SAM protein with 4Fe4S-binding SPASM domain
MNCRSSYYNLLTAMGIFFQRQPWCGPRIAQLNISDNCNLDCAICNRSSMGVSGLLDGDETKSLIDALYALGTQEIFFHGFGEPACHPQLPEMMRHVRARNPLLRQHLITNGTWDSADLSKAILDCRVHARFSLHAGDPETWQRLHPRDSVENFSQAGKNLLDLASQCPEQVEVLYVICNANCGAIPEMASFAASHGVRKILFRPMRLFKDRHGFTMNASLLPSAEQYQDASRMIEKLQHTYHGRISIQSIPFEHNCFDAEQGRPSSRDFYNTRSCYIGYALTVIERDGNVWGCLPESSDGVPLGNIHETPFKEIWYGSKYQDFRRKQLFQEKESLNPLGCQSYCQHLETNIRLNRLKPWRRFAKPSARGSL